MPQTSFLKILKAAICSEVYTPEKPLTQAEWQSVFRLAENHRVLPLIFDAAYPILRESGWDFENIRSVSHLLTSQQALHTQNFLSTYKALADMGLEPLVVKGIVCRCLYRNSDLRASSDEDLLTLPDDAESYRQAFDKMGFVSSRADENNHYEASYRNKEGLRLELHKSLFPMNSTYFEKYNGFFEDAFEKAIYITVENIQIKTLCPTHHLLYLLLHCLKHFIHSGVGIRQICDIVLFANRYGSEIDWQKLYECCDEARALGFAAAIYKIGETHLGFDKSQAQYPTLWQSLQTETEPLLRDILCAGVYGSADMSRAHSSSFTLRAAQGEKETLARRLFPPAKSLGTRYRYAKKHPVLLPVAWSHRLFRYTSEITASNDSDPCLSVKIGKERLELLRKYKILPEKS